jgi:hypothetical protein
MEMLANTIQKEGAVLRLPSILLLSAQSRRGVILEQFSDERLFFKF